MSTGTTQDWQLALSSGVPTLLWGPPGIGKSASVQALADDGSVVLETLIGSTLDPTDLGRLVHEDGRLKWVAPPWADRLVKALKEGRKAWLFLDEFTCVPPAVQAAFLRLVQEKRIGDTSLAGVQFIAAANDADQAADGYDLELSTLNRWAHFDFTHDVDTWLHGELGGWGDPDPELFLTRAKVTSWIRKSPGSLLQVPEQGARVRGWPSPRSWSNLCRLPLLTGKLVTALVGPIAAKEFLAWKDANDLPNPEDVLSGAVSLTGMRGDQQYCALGACVAYAVSHGEESHAQLWRLLRGQRKDLGVTFGRSAVGAFRAAKKPVDTSNKDLKEITSWLVRNSN